MKKKAGFSCYGLSFIVMICVLGSVVIHAAETPLKTGSNSHPPNVFPVTTGAAHGEKNALILTPAQRTWLSTHPTIRVAFDGYFPPYSYLTDEGHVEGLSVDVLRALADRIGIRFDIHPSFVWKDLFEAAKKKEVDVVATMVQKSERMEWFTFTRPYIYKSLAIMTRADDKSIGKREDIAGKQVALVRDYHYVQDIFKDFPTLKPYYVDTMLDGLNAVATGNADAAIIFFGAASHLKTKYGISNLKFAAVYDRSSALESIGVRKDWPELAAILDKALSLIDQTEWQAWQQKWHADEALVASFQESGFSRQWKILLLALAAVAVSALFAITVVSAWNRSLREQVKVKTLAMEEKLAESSRMAAALQESEEKFRVFFNSINDAVFVHLYANKGFEKIIEVNDIACQRYGYSKEEFLELTPGDISVQKDVQKHGRSQARKKLLENGFMIFEAEHINRWGKSFPVEISSSIIDLNEQKVILSVARDITDRKQAEEALRASHNRFLTVLDSIDATIYVADMETYDILFMNKNMIKSFGKNMTGKKCFAVFRGESEPCSICSNDQLIDKNGKPTGVCIWQGENPVNKKWYINYECHRMDRRTFGQASNSNRHYQS
ncbi:MAG: transporter substrate-binding domain-containing protein [Thermodesulfobacteriota bacterium]|nr:transporter substrate-binding domain-containing protein [Thermodesulfobacteriota bacterium]